MKLSIRIVALCLVVASVVSAIITASAAAELPEYRTCIKASPKESGKFNDKSCSIASKGGKKEGDYELGAWNQGKKVTFIGKNGETTLDSYIPESEAEPWTGGTVVGKVVCKSGKSKGEVTGPKTSIVTVEFKTCTSEGKKCTSAGAKAGTIVTQPLLSILGYSGGQVTSADLEVFRRMGGVNAEFNCEGPAVETSGAVLGVDTGNINLISKDFTQTFAVNAKGGQDVVFSTVEEGSPLFLTSLITPPGLTLPGGENTTAVLKGEAMEIEA
jgi:hypothetical protein